jgi:hypothetical protein
MSIRDLSKPLHHTPLAAVLVGAAVLHSSIILPSQCLHHVTQQLNSARGDGRSEISCVTSAPHVSLPNGCGDTTYVRRVCEQKVSLTRPIKLTGPSMNVLEGRPTFRDAIRTLHIARLGLGKVRRVPRQLPTLLTSPSALQSSHLGLRRTPTPPRTPRLRGASCTIRWKPFRRNWVRSRLPPS